MAGFLNQTVYDGGSRRFTLLNKTDITAAESIGVETLANGRLYLDGLGGANYIGFKATFTYVASSATSAKAYVQTSFDGGTTWFDIACFAFTTATLDKVAAVTTQVAATHATPADGALADNTVANGLIGGRLRVKFVSVGTYGAGTILKIDCFAKV